MKDSIKSNISRMSNLLCSGTFTSDQVKLIYVDLRDYSVKGSITREIGDYIAHPKGKDRGITHDCIRFQYEEFNKLRDFLSGRGNNGSATIKVKPAFNGPEIVDDLITQMGKVGIKITLPSDLYAAMELCIISILQDAEIIIDKSLKYQCQVGFDDGVINLNVPYNIKIGNIMSTFVAAVIQGIYYNNEVGRGTKQLMPGNIFNVIVNKGKPEIIFNN